jgi:hypothetical protein
MRMTAQPRNGQQHGENHSFPGVSRFIAGGGKFG